jgi:hypothetical protein
MSASTFLSPSKTQEHLLDDDLSSSHIKPKKSHVFAKQHHETIPTLDPRSLATSSFTSIIVAESLCGSETPG